MTDHFRGRTRYHLHAQDQVGLVDPTATQADPDGGFGPHVLRHTLATEIIRDASVHPDHGQIKEIYLSAPSRPWTTIDLPAPKVEEEISPATVLTSSTPSTPGYATAARSPGATVIRR